MATSGFCVSASTNFSMMNAGLMTTRNTCINITITGAETTTSAITNSGDIVSTLSSAIVSAEAGLTIQNSGLISGRSTAISLGSSDVSAINRINNSGVIDVQPTTTIDSAIRCLGTLRLVNSGTIFGNLSLGDGDDIVDTRIGTISGTISLDEGNNLFLGGALGETVTSSVGLDTLRGNAGDDSLSSGLGNDLMRGGDGDDTLRGSFGEDAVFGGLGDDILEGGNDADRLSGGTGKDVFAFVASGDSDLGQTADQITDFRRGDDRIDLSAFAPTVFTYVGSNALSGGGNASFGFDKMAGKVVVLADLNGDGTADFHIEVLAMKSLALSDFLL
jgi:Ca2+-binding RTX toxin-like protein